MFDSETSKARSDMTLASGFIVMSATLGAVILWTSEPTGGWVAAGVMVGAGLAVIAVAWFAGVWLRNRQRRRLMDLRDSALW